MSESDTMFNERDRRCTAVQHMLSTDPSYDNRTITSTLKMQIRTVQRNQGDENKVFGYGYGLWSGFKWGSRHTTSHLRSRLESQHQCTWMCWRVWWSPGAIRWPVADPGYGSRTRRRPTSPRRPRLCFRKTATTFYPFLTDPLLPRPEPAVLLRLVIRRQHHQHDLPQHQSQPDHRHPPTFHRAPAGACGKGMFQVPDLYQGGDWGWRRLHWIDVSSTT